MQQSESMKVRNSILGAIFRSSPRKALGPQLLSNFPLLFYLMHTQSIILGMKLGMRRFLDGKEVKLCKIKQIRWLW